MTPEVEVRIDPEFRGLCPPLSDDEYQQLEANILADGCRDPLVMWEEEDTVLDGHNRYDICLAHNLLFEVSLLSLPSREDAINWIINNQLGRRNLTEEQKSNLRGKRYNREKRKEGAPRGNQNATKQLADNRLVVEPTYSASLKNITSLPVRSRLMASLPKPSTPLMSKYAAIFVRPSSNARHVANNARRRSKSPRQASSSPRRRWTRFPSCSAKAGSRMKCSRRLRLLGTVPHDEHAVLNLFLDRPFLPAAQGLQILKNLQAHKTEQRQHIYALAASSDSREQSLAMTLAAQKAPEPDPQVILAGNLIKSVEEVRERQRRNWRLPYATEPWTPILEEIDHTLATVQERWRGIARQAETVHAERIASHAESFDPSR